MPQSFTVDLGGLVELLSEHLYSGPQVFLRELLQNAVDASTARLTDEPDAGPMEIRFRTSTVDGRPAVVVTDQGLGMNADDAARFMSVIGHSSKRDEIGMARESLIGQFGVGLLSCFAVSDAITVVSQTVGAEPGAEWIGSSDGTWTVRELEDRRHGPGTEVTVVARPGDEQLFTPEFVERHLRVYGEFLPFKIWLDREDAGPALVSTDASPLWNSADPERHELAARLLKFAPHDLLVLDAPAGQTRALAAVLPHAPAPNAMRSDRVYVKNMLVSEESSRLLPDWAFFVSCVAFSDGLRPTASREDIHEDRNLRLTREDLGAALRTELLRLGADEPERLRRIIDVHFLSMKALAVTDADFLALVADWLPIDTSVGRMPFGEFRRRFPVAVYTQTVEEFQQLAPICSAQEVGLVNGGYTHDAELIRAAAAVLDDFDASPADLQGLFAGFGEVGADDESWVATLNSAAEDRVTSVGAVLEIRTFEPHEVPALLAMDSTANLLRRFRHTRERSGDLFAGLNDSLAGELDESAPIFCLNAANPVVRSLGTMVDDPAMISATVDVLYLYATLTGHHPLGVAESAMLNTSLVEVIARAAANSLPDENGEPS